MPEKEYIEREALIKTCEEIIQIRWNETTAPVSWSHAYADFIDDIEEQPVADVTEINHGEWIDKQPYTYNFDNMTLSGTGERCSLCGWINKGGVDKYTNYCPNCGAKMSKSRHG